MDFYIARHSQIARKRKKMGQKESARAVNSCSEQINRIKVSIKKH
jgi:hypothetical protein